MSVNLYPIPGPWPNAELATAACPRGNDVRLWMDANVRVVVSALACDEAAAYRLDEEEAQCRQFGLDFVHFPVGDHQTPVTMDTIDALVTALTGHLEAGRSVVIHCRAGIGRASLLAACTLVRAGVGVEEAFARISRARGIVVPDSQRQREWVEQFAARVATSET